MVIYDPTRQANKFNWPIDKYITGMGHYAKTLCDSHFNWPCDILIQTVDTSIVLVLHSRQNHAIVAVLPGAKQNQNEIHVGNFENTAKMKV
jgi:hypothetical protein